MDLRSWIDDQMRAEKLDHPSCESSDTPTPAKGQENLGMNVMSLKDVGVKEVHKKKLLKHQLPGNSLLSEKEDAKLGARQNRYGVFSEGENEFNAAVEIKREKMAPKAPILPHKYSTAENKQVKKHVNSQMSDLAKRTGGAFSQDNDLDEVSADVVPTKEVAERKPYRKVVNQTVVVADEDEQINVGSQLPGVTNTRTKQSQIDAAAKAKEAKATLVIQKFLRGHWGRQKATR